MQVTVDKEGKKVIRGISISSQFGIVNVIVDTEMKWPDYDQISYIESLKPYTAIGHGITIIRYGYSLYDPLKDRILGEFTLTPENEEEKDALAGKSYLFVTCYQASILYVPNFWEERWAIGRTTKHIRTDLKKKGNF
jgi:hypothetical protein